MKRQSLGNKVKSVAPFVVYIGLLWGASELDRKYGRWIAGTVFGLVWYFGPVRVLLWTLAAAALGSAWLVSMALGIAPIVLIVRQAPWLVLLNLAAGMYFADQAYRRYFERRELLEKLRREQSTKVAELAYRARMDALVAPIVSELVSLRRTASFSHGYGRQRTREMQQEVLSSGGTLLMEELKNRIREMDGGNEALRDLQW